MSALVQHENAAVTKREDKDQQKIERVKTDEWLRNLAEILELPAGRRVLWTLLGRAHIFESTVQGTVGQLDLAAMAVNEGERQLGLWLVDQITEAAPLLWIQMQKDALDEANESQTTATSGKGDS